MRGANKEERHVGNWLQNRSVLVLMAVLLGPLGAPVAAQSPNLRNRSSPV